MVHPTMFASQWFITLFSYSLPFDVVLRIWDIFMLEARRNCGGRGRRMLSLRLFCSRRFAALV